MIRILKCLADWLDNRFPAKVHVTDAGFQDLLKRETARQMHLNTLAAAIETEVNAARSGHRLYSERIDAIEGAIVAVKEFVSKAAEPAAAAAARRAKFIEDGRME